MDAAVPQKLALFEGVKQGVGVWSWGDKMYWGFGSNYQAEDIRAAFTASLEAGINFFDTAEVYGQGRSESYLGEFIRESGKPVKVATKFMPFPWRLRRSSLLKALQNSLKRLGLASVDLYQIHQPLPPVPIETWMEAMVEARQAGLLQEVGVSNYDRRDMQTAYDALTRQGCALASNQIEYNLLNRKAEKSGLLNHCRDLGVTVIAYSPLAMGVLTGKYSPEKPMPGSRSWRFSRRRLAQIQPLLTLLRRIGADHSGKRPAQVAINWAICKGTLAIPGAKNQVQAEENAGASGWSLTEDEVAVLDEMSDRVNKEE